MIDMGYYLHVESKKNYTGDLFTKQKQTHGPRKLTMVTKEKGGDEEQIRSLGLTYTHNYI